jgi:hypothetical protein
LSIPQRGLSVGDLEQPIDGEQAVRSSGRHIMSRVGGLRRSRNRSPSIAGHRRSDTPQSISRNRNCTHISQHASHIRLSSPNLLFQLITSPHSPSRSPAPRHPPSGLDQTTPERSCFPPTASSRSRACHRGYTARPRRLRRPSRRRLRRGSGAPSLP